MRPNPLKTAATIRAHDEAMTVREGLFAIGRALWCEGGTEDTADEDCDLYPEGCESCATGRAVRGRALATIRTALTDYAATQERLAVVEEAAKHALYKLEQHYATWRAIQTLRAALRTTLEDGRDGL